MKIIRFSFLLVEFIIYFIWELVISNMRVTRDVLRPVSRLRPGIVAMPLDLRSDGAITLLANVIALTPGTIALDVSADRKFMYIHAIQLEDKERVLRSLKGGLERRVRELFE
jgi:multicomponent Na+:H+ antiporter subunit E